MAAGLLAASSAFTEGEDVLLREQDGLLYLGVVVETDPDTNTCVVRFGDGQERRAQDTELRRLGTTGNCSPPPPPPPPPPLPAVKIRPPTSPPPILTPYGLEDVPEHVTRARKELPYDFDSLLWDEAHQRNDKERYCYCGESGDWYKKMLQCQRCLQWFHQECIRTLNFPLLFGDRFYEFVCTVCTGTSEEVIRRLHLGWVDALHLVLFNLTVINSKKYHDLETSVLPFFKRRLPFMQPPSNGQISVLKSSRIEPHYIGALLVANKSRFKCGSEIKKRSTFWGLRKVVPPLAPNNEPIPVAYFKCSGSSSSKLLQRRRPLLKRGDDDKGSLKLKLIVNNKKRGRPRKPRDSLDSNCGADSCSDSSRGTLDSFIPPPLNFEGFNNPFRSLGIFTPTPPFTVTRGHRKPRRLFNTNTPSLGSAGSSPPSSTSSTASHNNNSNAVENNSLFPPPLPIAIEKDCNKITIEEKDEESEEEEDQNRSLLIDLKCSLNSYFGATNRIAKGEKFNVAARRLNLDGDIQHLIQWDKR